MPSKSATTVTSKPHSTTSGGTCPGDGRCDGTGGTSACSGCPTYNNNVLALSARQELESAAAEADAAMAVIGGGLPESPSGKVDRGI
jgi:hypothetical protein